MSLIGVIGSGAWGTTIANILSENRHDVVLWSRNKEFSDSLEIEQENKRYLSGIRLSKDIRFSSDLRLAVENKEIIFIAVPSQHVREVGERFRKYVSERTIIVNLAKGIEIKTHKRMSEILEEIFPNPIITLSGPNYSIEVANKLPTATVIASKNKEALVHVKNALSTSYFKVYPHSDIIGVELCGSIKNITAIAAGIISGMGYGYNSLASIITLGLTEMNTLGRLYGASRSTVYGLAGVGDLALTCMGSHSRNQLVGRELANGKSLEEIYKILDGKIAEGIETAKAVHDICIRNSLRMPLTEEIFQILYGNKKIEIAVRDLLGKI